MRAPTRGLLALVLAVSSCCRPVVAAFSKTPAEAVQAAAVNPSAVVHTMPALSGKLTAHWTLDIEQGRMFVALTAQTTGWVGLGFGEAAAMRGADIAVAHVDGQGKAHVADYHAIGNRAPIMDGCQDWTAHYGEENNGNTLVVISRKFLTNDTNDRPILLTGLKRTTLLLAFGASDALAYHNADRVKLMLDLSTGASADKAAFVARLNATEGMSYIDLRFNEATAPSVNGVSSDRFKTPDAGGREILTTDRTNYWDYCFTTGDNPGWNAHQNKVLIAFNGILDPNASRPDLVHHAVLYAYGEDNCWNDESIIWVGGTTDAATTEFPADVGMKFNRFRSFRIQVHYDNPDGSTNLKDNSGVRMWLSSTARKHEAGTIQLGDPGVALSTAAGLKVPPGRSMWMFRCPSSVTESWHEITVIQQTLHMHELGDMMSLEVQDMQGTIVSRPNSVEYFDFAHQDSTLVQPFKIKPGDALTTRCFFDNPGSSSVPFGQGSNEEMCIDFITYYPYLESNKDKLRATQYCGLGAGGEFVIWKTLDTTDLGMRVFGTDPGAPDDARCAGSSATTSTTTGGDAATTPATGKAKSYHLPSYSCPEGFDCLFQNSCPSLFGAPCPAGYICTHPADSKTSSFACPGDYDNNAEPMCTGADYDNDMERGSFLSDKCKEGQYCPNTTTVINCPAGTYCTEESTKAEPCGGLVICAQGATFPVSLAVLVVAVVYVAGYQVIAMCACGRKPAVAAGPATGPAAPSNKTAKTHAETSISGLEFQFDNLHLHKYGKDLLRDCSGKIQPGELVAVMGPSGAGKTTFMNVLMGKLKPTSGKVTINGIDGLSFHEILSLTGYVPQSDIMFTDLTVAENLMHAANTRVIGSKSFKAARVNAVLGKLGISHVRDSVIGDDRKRGLSGGERKRVSIGMELVANPAVLCLDEPTTGLDSASAEVVVDLLRSLADDGHTVICILHQPRAGIFRSFDRVLTLARGGVPAFMDTPANCRMFAKACGGACPEGKNPADHLIDLVSGRIPGISSASVVDTCKSWRTNSNPLRKANKNDDGEGKEVVTNTAAAAAAGGANLIDPRQAPSTLASPCAQFGFNFVRAMRQQMRDFGSTALYAGLVVVMIASLSTGFSPFIQSDLGSVYRPPIGESLRKFCPPFMGDSCGAVMNLGGLEQMLFFFPMALGCIGMIAASRAFNDGALLVMRREAEVGLSTAATCFAKMAADLIQVIMLALLAMGLWSLMGYPGGQWRWFVLGLGMLWTTYGWGYLVSQVCSRDAIMTVCLVVAVVFSAMNGVNPSLKDVNKLPVVNWLWACSFSRWVSEGIYFIFTEHHINSGIDVQHGADELGFLVSPSQFGVDLLVLYVHGVVLRVVTGILVVRRVTNVKL